MHSLFISSQAATTLRGHFGSMSFFAQIEKCSQVLMGRSNNQNQTLPPAPVVECIAPAPVVSPEGNFFAPAPAVYAAPAPVDEHVAPVPAVYAALAPVDEYASRPLLPCTLRQRQWRCTSHPLQPCTRHLHQWRSTSRPLQPCTRHLHLWWSTLHPCPQCFKRQRQWWSLLRSVTRQCSLFLRMHRTRLRLKTCTRAPGSRWQCPSKLVLRRSVRRPWARRARHRL